MKGFKEEEKKCVSGFSLYSPSNIKAVGQREEENTIYLFPFSLFILYIYHSGNQRHSINASFQFYFVLELGGCTFFLLLLSAVMLLHNLTTSILDDVLRGLNVRGYL